jgi:heat shock protein HspQ
MSMRIGIITQFSLGQVVYHRDLEYRGVVVDVDPMFLGDSDTATRAVGFDEPLNRPWYHVLGDGKEHVTYVSENSLTADDSGEPVSHPSLGLFFKSYEGDHYVPRRITN